MKGFEKVELQPGEESEVAIELDRRAFAFYNTAINDWHVESGSYEIRIGASSRDIRLTGKIDIASTQTDAAIAEKDQLPAYNNFPANAQIGQADFETLLGYPLPNNQILEKEIYTMNSPIGDMTGSFRWQAIRQCDGKTNREYGQRTIPTAQQH